MKYYTHIWIASLLGLLLLACRQDPKPPPPVAYAPAEVVQKWQGLIDSSAFAEARQYSTASAREWIDMLASLEEIEPTAGFLSTEFQRIDCQERADTAMCYCLLKEENEVYEDSFRLVRQAGYWLVDIPDDGNDMEMDEAEIIKHIEALMEEQAQ